MANKAQVEINVIGDASSAKKALNELAETAQGFGSKMKSAAAVAGGFVIGTGVLAAGGALMGLKDQAAGLELQLKKNTVVFGDQLGVVKDWAKANAGAMGLTATEATSLAAGLGDLLVPMGFTRDAAAEMSTKTIGLAGALAEWSNGQKTAAEVAEILQAAYLGETDSLQSLGIAISAADIEARLAAKGQEELTGQALKQAEALAIQELIFEGSTDAQKAFADGAESAARKQQQNTARMNEAKEALAIGLIPVFSAATTLMAGAMVPAAALVGQTVERLGPIFASVGDAIETFVAYFTHRFEDFEDAGPFAQLGFHARGIADTVTGVLLPAFQGLIAFLQNPTLPTLTDVASFIGRMTSAVTENQTAMAILTPVVGAAVAMYAAYRAIQLASTAAAWAHNAVTVALRAPTLAMAAAQGVLNAVMLANPFVLVTVLLAGLVAGLVVAYRTSDTFRAIVNNAWEQIRLSAAHTVGWFTTSFVPFFTSTLPGVFHGLRNALASIGGGIQSAITGPFERARDIVKPIFDMLGGWISTVKGWIGGIGGAGFMGMMGNATPGAGPVPGGVFTQGFGRTSFSGNYASGHHSGYDYAAPMGTPIYATRSGRVSTAGWLGGYGNAVMTDIGAGMQLLYGHMSQIGAKAGQVVRAGQVIGLVGSTGFSTGPHVHFEARRNGVAINPAAFLANGGFVQAGQPLLSVIGEGRHDEIVSPVPMMRQVVREELAAIGGGGQGATYNVTFITQRVSDDDVYRAVRRLETKHSWRRA